jgi:hypothetical protein
MGPGNHVGFLISAKNKNLVYNQPMNIYWKHQERKYDFTANINIRSNSGSDVKLRTNDVDLEADIVATSQRPL